MQKVVAYMEEWCSLCKIILQVQFANLFFLHCLWRTYCINWSLFRMHMPKKTIAYVEGNSCTDVGSTHSESNVALFGKAFALVCFAVFIYYSCFCFG